MKKFTQKELYDLQNEYTEVVWDDLWLEMIEPIIFSLDMTDRVEYDDVLALAEGKFYAIENYGEFVNFLTVSTDKWESIKQQFKKELTRRMRER